MDSKADLDFKHILIVVQLNSSKNDEFDHIPYYPGDQVSFSGVVVFFVWSVNTEISIWNYNFMSAIAPVCSLRDRRYSSTISARDQSEVHGSIGQ